MTTFAWSRILLRADSEVYLVNNTDVTVDQDVFWTGADDFPLVKKQRGDKRQEDELKTNANRRKMLDRVSQGQTPFEPEPEEIEDVITITPAPKFVPARKAEPQLTESAFIYPPINITDDELEAVVKSAAEFRNQVLSARRRLLLATLKGKK